MKQQVLNLKVSGLYTNPNQFSEIPQGALSIAEKANMVELTCEEVVLDNPKFGPVYVG